MPRRTATAASPGRPATLKSPGTLESPGTLDSPGTVAPRPTRRSGRHRPTSPDRRAARRAAAAAPVLMAAALVAGCGSGNADAPGDRPGGSTDDQHLRAADDPRVAPLPGGRADVAAPAPTVATTATTVGGTTVPAAGGAPPATAVADDATLRAEVDDALARYDAALSALAADPSAAAEATSAVRRTWASVVDPGSSLHDALVDEVLRRAAEDGAVVVPPADGPSYRHRALRVGRTSPTTVEFTWCGHAPGTGRDLRTGAVVDDAVGHSHGTGVLRTGPGGPVVESLDQTDLVVLGPGTPDPCAAEVPR